jgi:zinc/manganese transport system permease protein
LWAAYAIGVLGYFSGLVLSALFDLPSGALIVWTLAGCALLAQLVPGLRRRAADAAGAEDADLAP